MCAVANAAILMCPRVQANTAYFKCWQMLGSRFVISGLRWVFWYVDRKKLISFRLFVPKRGADKRVAVAVSSERLLFILGFCLVIAIVAVSLERHWFIITAVLLCYHCNGLRISFLTPYHLQPNSALWNLLSNARDQLAIYWLKMACNHFHLCSSTCLSFFQVFEH